MSDDIPVIATSRSVYGKGASRRLRRENLVPAILYGDEKEPQALQLKHNEVLKHLQSEAFYSQLLSLTVDDQPPVRTLLKDIQRHPYKQQILHMDFVRVVAGAELQVTVPVHFINEDVCVGVKTGGGIIMHLENDVTVACRPRDIPEYITVDMANLDIGDSVHLSGLAMPENVRLVELNEAGDNTDRAVASVNAPRVEAEPEEDGVDAPEVSTDDSADESSSDS
ncbi:MAG: 50S ribosomal protein L25/general stress protein Ctc [Granulosicoccus sp.]